MNGNLLWVELHGLVLFGRLKGFLKVGLRKVLAKALITFDELHNILLELEATINDNL